jgi:hypothetical protein
MQLEKEFEKLEEERYDFALAIATEQEVRNGAACGQLAMIADII